jgi:hypothetical protein
VDRFNDVGATDTTSWLLSGDGRGDQRGREKLKR